MRTSTTRFTLALGLVLIATTACNGASSGSPAGPAASAAPSALAAPVASASTAASGGDWNGFRGDATRRAVGAQGPTGNPVLNWQFKAGGAVPDQIAIAGDTVFFASDDGLLHAIDRSTGQETWKQDLKIRTTGPTVVDGRMYLVDEEGTVRALDPATGATLWTTKTAYDGPTQPISADGSVYVGTGDGNIVALDPATGAEQWTVKLAPDGARPHNPAAADGFVYAGTAGSGFVAVDAKTHSVAWTGDLHGDDTGTAVVADGIAYIAAGADATSGTLHAFDARTGKLLWDAPAQGLQSPTILDGMAFSATSDGLVDAIETKTGALRWSIKLYGKVRPMAIVGSSLFLSADEEHRVYAVEAATGGRLWQFDVDDSNDCCIAVAKGAVYVGTMAGSVYSIGGDGATIAAQPFASAAASAPPATQAPSATDIPVTVSWTTDIRGKGFSPVCQIAIDPTTGRIWAPEAESDKIAIFDPSGKLVEEWGASGDGHGQFEFARQNGDGYGTLAFAKDGSFFVLDVGNRRVQHFDANRKLIGGWGSFGDEPGQFNDPVGIVVADDGTVWVVDDRRSVVEHYDADGTVLGSFDPFASLASNEGANNLAIDADGNLRVSSAVPAEVLVFDPHGTLLRTIGAGNFAEQAGNMAIDADGRLFITQGPGRGTAPGVLVFAKDGTLTGGFAPLGDGDGQLVFPGGIALDGKGGLVIEDSEPESNRLMRFALPADWR